MPSERCITIPTAALAPLVSGEVSLQYQTYALLEVCSGRIPLLSGTSDTTVICGNGTVPISEGA